MTALLEVPADYRQLLLAAASDGSAEERVRRPGGAGGWSAVEYTAHVAEVLHVSAMRLLVVLEQSRADLEPIEVGTSREAWRNVSIPVVLGSLSSAATDLTRVAAEFDPRRWRRTARVGGVETSARDLLDDALHEAHHHLADCRRLVERPELPFDVRS